MKIRYILFLAVMISACFKVSAAESDTVYTVVISSMKHARNAKELAKTMEEMGLNAQILKMQTPVGEMHRICIEKSIRRDGAEKTVKQINDKTGINKGWVLKVEDYNETLLNSKDVNNVTEFGKTQTLAAEQTKNQKELAEKKSKTIPSTDLKNLYTVVLASMKYEDGARKIADAMKSEGVNVQIFKMTTGKGEMHRVCTEPVDSREKANNLRRLLGKSGRPGWILPVPNYNQLVAENAEFNRDITLEEKKAGEQWKKTVTEMKTGEVKAGNQKSIIEKKEKEAELARRKALEAKKAEEAELARRKTLEAKKAEEAELARRKALEAKKAEEAELARRKTLEAKKAEEAELARRKALEAKKAEEAEKTPQVKSNIEKEVSAEPETVDVATAGNLPVSVVDAPKKIEKAEKPEKPKPIFKTAGDTIPKTGITYGEFFEKLKEFCYALENYNTENDRVIQNSIDTIYGTYIQTIRENLITSNLIKEPRKIYKNYSINKNINDFYREIYKVRRQEPKYTQLPTYDCDLGAVPGNSIFIFEYNGNIDVTRKHMQAMTVRNKELSPEEKERVLVSGISINVGVAIGGAKLMKAMYFSVEDGRVFLRCIDLTDPCELKELHARTSEKDQKSNSEEKSIKPKETKNE